METLERAALRVARRSLESARAGVTFARAWQSLLSCTCLFAAALAVVEPARCSAQERSELGEATTAPPTSPPAIDPPAAQAADRAARALRADTFVQSGGISLGSYGAGFAYYYVRERKVERMQPFRVVTGASAGSINAVMAAIASCMKQEDMPTQSMFYQTWINVGIQHNGAYAPLADPDAVTARSLLSRTPIEQVATGSLRTQFEAAGKWEKECDVLLGLVTTRKRNHSVPLQVDSGSATPRVTRQSEKFVLRMKRSASDRSTAILPWFAATDETDPTQPTDYLRNPPNPLIWDVYPLLGTQPRGSVSFDVLLTLMQASSSVPFAFAPRDVPTLVYDQTSRGFRRDVPTDCSVQLPDGGTRACIGPEYYDGALYENVPVTLAGHLLSWLAPRSSPMAARIRDESNPSMVVMDYDPEGWQRARSPEAKEGRNFLSTLLELLGNEFNGATGAEYFNEFLANPKTRDPNSNLVIFPARLLPPASNHLHNFLGFFERDFRIFDFVLGMLDAQRLVGGDIPSNIDDPAWQKLACLRAWKDASAEFRRWPTAAPAECARVANTSRWDAKNNRWQDTARSCNADANCIENRNFVRLIAAAQAFRRRTEVVASAGGFDDLEEWFRAMEYQGVHYTQLEVKDADDARANIRQLLDPVLDELPKRQEGVTNRLAMSILVPVAANAIQYREPNYVLSFETSPARAFGVNVGFRLKTDYLRLELGHRFYDIDLRKPNVSWAMYERARLVTPLRSWWSWLTVEPFVSVNPSFGFTRTVSPQWRGLNSELGSYLVVLQRVSFGAGAGLRAITHQYSSFHPDLWGSNRRYYGFFDLGWRCIWF